MLAGVVSMPSNILLQQEPTFSIIFLRQTNKDVVLIDASKTEQQ
jgi:hypothetical protein